ncbi:ATP-binding cassette domain-containing protein [Micromonospora sp. NPDC048170]|uniref:ATP-binding cassette domain-containing protein n=1 Tax=Micromonospora sp. NPDC048170 TaxID=3154819 RepID=UPI0033DD194B
MRPAVVEIHELVRACRARREADETVAPDGVSLTVDDCEILGILGPNGAGKNALVKILSTILLPAYRDGEGARNHLFRCPCAPSPDNLSAQSRRRREMIREKRRRFRAVGLRIVEADLSVRNPDIAPLLRNVEQKCHAAGPVEQCAGHLAGIAGSSGGQPTCPGRSATTTQGRRKRLPPRSSDGRTGCGVCRCSALSGAAAARRSSFGIGCPEGSCDGRHRSTPKGDCLRRPGTRTSLRIRSGSRSAAANPPPHLVHLAFEKCRNGRPGCIPRPCGGGTVTWSERHLLGMGAAIVRRNCRPQERPSRCSLAPNAPSSSGQRGRQPCHRAGLHQIWTSPTGQDCSLNGVDDPQFDR